MGTKRREQLHNVPSSNNVELQIILLEPHMDALTFSLALLTLAVEVLSLAAAAAAAAAAHEILIHLRVPHRSLRWAVVHTYVLLVFELQPEWLDLLDEAVPRRITDT